MRGNSSAGEALSPWTLMASMCRATSIQEMAEFALSKLVPAVGGCAGLFARNLCGSVEITGSLDFFSSDVDVSRITVVSLLREFARSGAPHWFRSRDLLLIKFPNATLPSGQNAWAVLPMRALGSSAQPSGVLLIAFAEPRSVDFSPAEKSRLEGIAETCSIAAALVEQRMPARLEPTSLAPPPLCEKAPVYQAAAPDESRDLLLGILAHDLRNPLQAIRMSTGFVRRLGGLHARAANAIDRIERSAVRMNGMVEQLTHFARAKRGGGLSVARAHGDLHPLVRQIVEEQRAAHPDRDLVVEVEGDGRGSWDLDRLGQLLSNLIGNAVQHGERSGPIAISVRDGEQEIALDIRNAGTIQKQAQAVIFEPFRSCSPGAPGSDRLGLGLYIAQQIVDSHDGTITVCSPDAQGGTTFSIRLPRAARPVESINGVAPAAFGEVTTP